MICPRCGAVNDDEAQYCRICNTCLKHETEKLNTINKEVNNSNLEFVNRESNRTQSSNKKEQKSNKKTIAIITSTVAVALAVTAIAIIFNNKETLVSNNSYESSKNIDRSSTDAKDKSTEDTNKQSDTASSNDKSKAATNSDSKKDNSNSTEQYTAREDFDYSNRYTNKEYTSNTEKSNTGDSVVDSTWDMTNKLFDDTQKVITDANNHIQQSATVLWGFKPQKLSYADGKLVLGGMFYNNNQYATVNNITNLKLALIDSNDKVVVLCDFAGNQQLSQIQLPINGSLPMTFTLTNVPANLDFKSYACMINSDFKLIYDDEKIKRDHPDIYNAVQFKKAEAEKYYQRSNDLADDYVTRVNSYIAERAKDAASY